MFLYFVSMFLRILAAWLLACRGGIVAKSPFNVAKSPLVLQKVRAIHSFFLIVAACPLLLQVENMKQ